MNPAQQDALRYALMTSLAAGLGGSGMALASHMNSTAGRPALEDLSTLAPETINIPYPKKKKKPGEIGQKAANWLIGDTAKHWWEVPILPAGLMAAGLTTGIGAHSMTKDYLNKRRKKQIQQKVEAAESDYRDALLNSYGKENLDIEKRSAIKEINEGLEKLAAVLKISALDLSKVPLPSGGTSVFEDVGNAAVSGIGTGLNKGLDLSQDLFKKFEKTVGKSTAGAPQSAANVLGGLALLTAAGIPTLTGIAAYKYFKGRDKSKMLNEAAKERQYARLTENVPEMYAGVEA